jgi:putative tricarboxylic transport membrane protein
MDLITNLSIGFGVAITPINLLYAFIGCLLGTLIGVLPGIGPVATIAMLLPATYALPPVSALIMLAGIYYGAQYGGSTTAILVNLPGESSSVVTVIDGYQMARQGRAGPALAAAGLGSFFAGCVGTLILAAFAAPLTEVAFKFGPAEYFSLMVLGLIGAVVLASGSLVKAVAMIVLGLLLGLVGTDVNSGVARYSFDIPELTDGIGFIVIAMGVFGYGEIISNLSKPSDEREVFTAEVHGLFPTKEDFRNLIPAVLRGTALGSALGILPGGGALLSAFAAYTLEKKTKLRHPGEVPFGKGNIRGVAAPESANNAGSQTSFIPLLTLGIPPNAVMALMVGAMTIHNIQPGPQVMTSNPQLFWGLIASMWIGNLMLIVLNLPLIGIWIKLLTVPYRWLFPAIVVFCASACTRPTTTRGTCGWSRCSACSATRSSSSGPNRRRCCSASSSGR